jgi:hypothetical protein
VTTPIDRLLDIPLPDVKGDPLDLMRRRVLSGAAMLGFWIGVGAILLSVLVNRGADAWPVVMFAAGCALITVMTRVGLPTDTVRAFAMALVSAFLVVDSLLGATMDWQQLKWLALLPMITRYLWDPTPNADGRRRHEFGPLAGGVVLALGLAAVIVLAHMAGLHGSYPVLTGDSTTATLSNVVDFALFLASIGGLFALYDRSQRRADAELRMLRSLLSMCAWCRRIHDGDDGWVSVERYMGKHSAAQLTHGMCPDCSAKAMAALG